MLNRRVPLAGASGRREEPGQVPHAVKNAQDHDLVAARLVEDEIVSEAVNGPGTDTDKFAEGALRTEFGMGCDEVEGLFCRRQEAICRIHIVVGDVAPVFLQIEADAGLDDVVQQAAVPPVCS